MTHHLYSGRPLVQLGRKGLQVIILSEAAALRFLKTGSAKDHCFVNGRSFASAQDDKPERDFRYVALVRPDR